jgi:cell cycle checkpoint protein
MAGRICVSLNLSVDSLAQTFQTFLSRATALRPLLGNAASTSSPSEASHVILLEDLPNLSHSPTLQSFQAAVLYYLEEPPGAPLVIIVSDMGTRGESKDESNWSKSDGVDIRTILPPAILNSAYVTQIVYVV